jgi:eukaryotic-like serine/threonine-protein kinase
VSPKSTPTPTPTTLALPRARLSPRAPVADPLIGMIVADRYRILEPVGRGGMGIVYKVEHVRIGKLLAMKVLAGDLSRDPEVVRRFKREALMVSRLSSPSTVQVFDFGVSEGLTYLVMELVRGETLSRALVAGGPMPFSRVGRIAIQICSSLAEAHANGIVHRDVKPDNIMLLAADGGEAGEAGAPADRVKVLDFGLAKLRDAEGLCDVTSRGLILGTPYYMAPEQIRGEEIDARADVYALGAVLYRVLTGYHVFAGPPSTVLARHLDEPPVPPAERAPGLGIPPGVSRLVMRALSKSPDARFQTVKELQVLLAGELDAAGSSSVAMLLDSGELRRLTLSSEPAYTDVGACALATRDEVDAYERKLRRSRHGSVIAGAALFAAAALGASVVVPRAGFTGAEIEPNDTAADATVIPLGRPVSGHLGKRIDESHGDRDFYAFDLPASAPGAKARVRIRVSAIPNLPMCTMLYRSGFPDALGQYCVGRPGRDLTIPALELDPGRYLLAVMQDLDPHGGAPSFIQENVSDAYTLVVDRTTPVPGVEVEPDDQLASATELELSVPCSASIGWARDEDVFCAPASAPARLRWNVHAGLHDLGVHEATLLGDGDEAAPVRIHATEGGKRSAFDVVSPWQSAPTAQRCLRVRVTADPWGATERAGAWGTAIEPYVVEVEEAP